MKIGDERDIGYGLREIARIVKKLEDDLWLVTIQRGQDCFNRKMTTKELKDLGFKNEEES